MTPNNPHQNLMPAAKHPPFELELRYLDLQPDGTFTPSAAVLVTPAFAESGLLKLLSPEEMQTLLLLLSSITANGTFVATAETLAPSLGTWAGQMRSRLERLISRKWDGEPMLRCYTTETGLRLFSPSPSLFEVRRSQITPAPDIPGVPLEMPLPWRPEEVRTASVPRETIIAHSRETYGRPRAEVEAEINRFLGYEEKGDDLEDESATPEEAARRNLERRLTEAGLTSHQARSLLDSYPEDRIETQLWYLPHRNARYPAGMLIASIEGDYAAPLGARIEPAIEATEQSENPRTDSAEPAREGEDADPVPVQHLNHLDSGRAVNLSLPADTVEPETSAPDSETETDA